MDDETNVKIVKKQKKTVLFKIGVGLLISYVPLWIIALIIPFTPITTGLKSIIVPTIIIAAELLFLLGAVFVGKEVATKYKRYLNPKNWHRSSKQREDD